MNVETENQNTEEAQVDETFNVDDLSLDDVNIFDGSESENSNSSEEGNDSETNDANASNSSDNTENQTQTSSDEAEDSEAGGAATDTEGEENADTTADSTTSTEQEDNEDNDQGIDPYLALSEETGVEVSSEDEIVGALKELASLRQNGSGTENLSEAIKTAIEVEQAGGNLADHFARVGMDFDNMEGKEVLRQKFFRDNAKLYSSNPKLAKMKFEKQYQNDYGTFLGSESLSDEYEKEEYLESNGDSIEYEKLMLENDIEEARAELKEWKEKAAPVEKSQEETVGGLSPEEVDRISKEYNDKAKASYSEFEAVEIPFGEDGEEAFALTLNDKTRPVVEGWVANPESFLRDIGFNGTNIDIDGLLPIMTLIAEASVGDLGGKIKSAAVDSDNANTIKNTLQKPSNTNKQIPQDRNDEGDIWDKVGEAAEQARQER